MTVNNGCPNKFNEVFRICKSRWRRFDARFYFYESGVAKISRGGFGVREEPWFLESRKIRRVRSLLT